MPGLLIKNLPKKIHERLKERARVNRRSMSAEVIVILERVLGVRSRPPTLEEIDRRIQQYTEHWKLGRIAVARPKRLFTKNTGLC